MTYRKPFISWAYDPQVNRERADIILDMLRFIQEGLRDEATRRTVLGFTAFENAVKVEIFEKMRTPLARPIPKRMLVEAGDTLDHVATAISGERNLIGRSAPLGAFKCARISGDLQQRLNSFWHPMVDEEHATVETAFEVTYSNVARATTRLVLIHAVPRLIELRSTPPEWSALRHELWIRKASFERDLLVFGGLAGGELLKTAVKHVALQTCVSDKDDIQFGVINFLQRDGISPGSWSADAEEGLRQSITKAFEAL